MKIGVVKKSRFKLDNFYILESNFSRTSKTIGKISIDIKPSGFVSKEKGIFQLFLDVAIKDDKETISIKVTSVAFFRFNKTENEEFLDNYFYVNSSAIIFPYIRAYISTMTAISGMEKIDLPTMNLTYLADELKSNTQSID